MNDPSSTTTPNVPTDPSQYRIQQSLHEMNRMGPLGKSLQEELESQINSGAISVEAARKIMAHFDFAYAEQLNVLEQQNSKIEGSLDANLDMSRFFDDTADLELSDVTIKYNNIKPASNNNADYHDVNSIARVKETDKMFIRAVDLGEVKKNSSNIK